MFDYFCVGLDAQLRNSMRNTIRYTPIQGGSYLQILRTADIYLSFGSAMAVVLFVWGKGEMVTPQGNEQR